jgi:hypothetical protein
MILDLNSGSNQGGALPLEPLPPPHQPFFALVIFQIMSCVFAQVSLELHLPIYIPHAQACTPTRILIEIGSCQPFFLPVLASNHDLPNLCVLDSWDYRHKQRRLASLDL